MKLTALILLLLILQPIHAKDFRALNFGDSCSNVESQEIELGSKKSNSINSAYEGTFTYNGLKLNEEALISYNCGDNNIFKSGYVFYRFLDFDNAEAFLILASQIISDAHGEPGEIIVFGGTKFNFKITYVWDLEDTSIVIGSNTSGNQYGIGLKFSQASN